MFLLQSAFSFLFLFVLLLRSVRNECWCRLVEETANRLNEFDAEGTFGIMLSLKELPRREPFDVLRRKAVQHAQVNGLFFTEKDDWRVKEGELLVLFKILMLVAKLFGAPFLPIVLSLSRKYRDIRNVLASQNKEQRTR